MGFADVRKGVSPQMHLQMHLSGGNVQAGLFNLGCFYCKRECRLVLSGANGWMVQLGDFLQ
ncbi:MAG: hypothetical protein ACXVKH_12725, partial [Candidatus Angelobacter sp.]